MNLKKIIALLTSAMLMIAPLTAFADPENDGETNSNTSSSDIIIDSTIEKGPDIKYAEAALLMDMSSGRLLYAKNPQERLYPASTTKMMTAIVALEKGNMEDKVVATYAALKDITNEDSHMGIRIGEELNMEQLMNGMLVYSANDAANVIAIHVAGSIEEYVNMMNEKAAELGMVNTHFENVCGIHDDNHYTTAEDLAILGKYCMQNETFREIVKKPIYSMPATNKYTVERNLPTTNLFLSAARSPYYLYQPCIGIKTGHTSNAGYCLVSAAEHDGIELLAVVLKCNNNINVRGGEYSYIDSKEMFQFGFNSYEKKVIAQPGEIIDDAKVYEAKNNLRVSVTVPDEISALVPKNAETADKIVKESNLPEQINAPIHKGDVIGSVTYLYDGTSIGKADLVAVNDVERNEVIHVIHKAMVIVMSPFFFIPVIIIIILIIIANQQRKKRERKRRIQQLKRNKQRNEGGYRTPNRKASRTQIQREESKGSTSRYKENK